MSIIAWHDSGLNIMFFFASSLRVQILFEPISTLSMASVFASSSIASVSEIVSVKSSFLRTVSVSMSEAIGPSCPTCCHFNGKFRTACTPVQCSFTTFTFVFTRQGTSVQEEECCCCYCRLCQFFFNVTSGDVLSFKPFETTRSPF